MCNCQTNSLSVLSAREEVKTELIQTFGVREEVYRRRDPSGVRSHSIPVRPKLRPFGVFLKVLGVTSAKEPAHTHSKQTFT